MHRLDPELRKLDAMLEALEPGRWDDVGCFKTETSDTL